MATASSSRAIDVLIVGAGPTGLVLAVWLARLGIRLRIIDKTSEPGTTSRAMAVQARTLEFYSQLGFADRVVAQGRWAQAANLWANGRHAARFEFGNIGAGLSPFPYALIYPQDEHERFLIEHLATLGVVVERTTELASFEQTEHGVRARLTQADGSEELCTAGYLAGCDGARSTVRERLGFGFPGGTYDHLFYVADVEANGKILNHELNVTFDQQDFLVVFPLKGDRRARFIGTVRDDPARTTDLTWDDVSKKIIGDLRTSVEKVNWFSTYRVHHRVAEHFRAGRIFLLGDAAHIHSPVGGQGMNTGIGDAVNLAWKLAATLHGAEPAVLDSYEPERLAFARRLVATTDRAFVQITSRGWLARLVRLDLAPIFAPILFFSLRMRRVLFRLVSQTAITYRRCSFNGGIAGRVWGGDRLPWVPSSEPTGNLTALRTLDWQVHVYGEAKPGLQSLCEDRGIPLHVFQYLPETRRAGLRRNAAYLIRPDGYVGLAEPDGDATKVAAYLDVRGISVLRS
ncbi:MAG TPA: FAD-dependent monooxygenase, partial [Terracidiphilus sp.]|nr:FAD-dependent monooxygenase [Terracidiphilus sp.]